MKFKSVALALLALSTLNSQLSTCFAQGTAFIYQGQLLNNGNPASGLYDFQFTLSNAPSGGSQVGSTVTDLAVGVSNGLFTTTLDFGPVFTGDSTWLAISVRTNGVGSYVGLNPLQQLTPVPQAIYASNAGMAGTATSAANVTSVGGQTASSVASGASAANAATSANTPGAIVARDGSGNFSASSVTLGSILYLPHPAIIVSGSNPTLIDEGSFFAGGAGNTTLTGVSDVGVGNQALRSVSTGSDNTAAGEYSLFLNTTGNNNTANGYAALENNTTGTNNTASGFQSLQSNTTANGNTAMGYLALQANTTKGNNTALGALTLQFNSAGFNNTAMGHAALQNNTNGNDNIAVGVGALQYSTNDSELVAIGYQALQNDSAMNTNQQSSSGFGDNTAVGFQALQSTTVGTDDTGVGWLALQSNIKGLANTAVGSSALQNNTSGDGNTASGQDSLYSNTSGTENTAEGQAALYYNTVGSYNVANGYGALYSNSGSYNTAEGEGALYYNTVGSYNAASGEGALNANRAGTDNTGDGSGSLYNNWSGSFNTAIGTGALSNLGVTTEKGGSNNIVLGFDAGWNLDGNESSNILVGHPGYGGVSDTIRIGDQQTATYIAGIYGATASGGVAVYVNNVGQLGTLPSSVKFKDDIRDMGDASSVLLSLRPVAFRYKAALDPKGIPQFGLVAEQVEKVDPDLVVHDPQHGIYTVRYQAVDAMMLNEFLKEHQKVQDLEQRLEKVEKLLDAKNGCNQ